jgi:hypothetical protein
MTVQREIDPVTGENVIVKYGPDGEPQAWYPDPGWLGAENELAGRKLAGYGGTMASVFTGEERDLERSAHWARKEPYFEALRQAYPNAAAVGEIVPSVALSIANPVKGGASLTGQVTANVGEALVEQWLTYDPLKEMGDYLDAGVNAGVGDLMFRGLGRILWGAEQLASSVASRGIIDTFRTQMPETAATLTRRGYKLTNPASMLERDDPMRPMLEQAFKSNQSSARPSSTSREAVEFNARKLNNKVRAALGLDEADYGFTTADLHQAQQRLDGVYEELAQELPERVDLPHAVALSLTDTPGYRKAASTNLNAYRDVRRYFNEYQRWQQKGAPAGGAPRPPTVGRDELFSLRSTLTKEAAETQDANVVRAVGERIDMLDQVVAAQAPGDDFLQRYARAREQWETLFAVQRPGVVGKEGSINTLALARSMASESNFGRTALYGDAGQFTNPETAELAGDVAALVQPETYANSQTTDRETFIKFATSAVQEPWYAAATLLNEQLVDRTLKAAERGMSFGGAPLATFGNQIPPAGEQVVPTMLYSPRGGRRNQGALLGSQIMSRPEDAGNVWTDSILPYLEGGLLPNEAVRDQALGPFTGTEDRSGDR